MNARTRAKTVAGLALGLLFASVPAAEAAHHLIKIKQVYPGEPGPAPGNNNEYVVLQLTSPNEYFFGTNVQVRLYNADGILGNTATSSGSMTGVPTNQSADFVATTGAVAAFSPLEAEMTFADNIDIIRPAGGAACVVSSSFGNLDCVGWGSLTDFTPPSPIGTLEPAIPDGQMLERSITANCATLHDFADDTNNSANDFAPADPAPRNSTSPIPETACAPPGGGGGNPSGGGGSTTPATTTPAKPKCKKGQKLVKGKCRKKKRKKK
jgi:hypothetical protein